MVSGVAATWTAFAVVVLVVLVWLCGKRGDVFPGRPALQRPAERKVRGASPVQPPDVPAHMVFGPLAAGRIPPRPAPRLAPPLIDPEDEAAILAAANLLYGEASQACRADAEMQANLAVIAEYVQRHEAKQRPRLVERADSDD